MKLFVIKWSSNRNIQSLLNGRVLFYMKEGNRIIVGDAETMETLVEWDNTDVIIEQVNSEIHIHGLYNSVFIREISTHQVSGIQLVRSTSTKLKTSSGIKNVKEFEFSKSISAHEFVTYLLEHNYISDNIKYEPENVMISRSRENPHIWIYREDLIR